MQADGPHIDTPCVILAGGMSRRFGGQKAFAKLNGVSLVELVDARLTAQTTGQVALNVSDAKSFAVYKTRLVPDIISGGVGPLAGLHAAMCWAERNGHAHVVTVAVDTPFLPDDLIRKFVKAGAPAIAKSGDQMHPVCGYWPTNTAPALEECVANGMRAVHAWAETCGAEPVTFPQRGIDPFFNINTREDLALAERTMER